MLTGAFPHPAAVVTGAGSSDYAARAIAWALSADAGAPARAIPSTDIVSCPEVLPEGPFWFLSVARSGNSPEGNAAFALVSRLRPEATPVVLSCNPAGELFRLGRAAERGAAILLPAASNDRGLAMTSSFTSLVLAGQALASAAAGRGSRESGKGRAIGGIEALATAAEGVLARWPDAACGLARLPFRRAVFVASPPLLAAAVESALKVQELTGGQVICQAETTLGLRHGPMAAIDGETLLVLYLSTDCYRRLYEADLLQELREKRLGLRRVLVGAAPAAEVAPAIDEEFLAADPEGILADMPDWRRVALYVIAGQLLGLFKACELGLSPDNPGRGVIHRVVQGVRIHPYAV